MKDVLDRLLDDHQLYHSNLQMDCFITAKSGGFTRYGQYKQALRELFKRYRGLKDLYIKRELLVIDIAESDSKIYDDKFETERLPINIIKYKMDLEDLDRNIIDTKREFCRFFGICLALKKELGDISEKRDKLDEEMWVSQLKEMAAQDYLSANKLSERTLTLLHSLPVSLRNKTWEEMKKGNEIVDWYMHTDHSLPKPIRQDEIEKLFSDMPKLLGLGRLLDVTDDAIKR